MANDQNILNDELMRPRPVAVVVCQWSFVIAPSLFILSQRRTEIESPPMAANGFGS
jgi:hypothetical protein